MELQKTAMHDLFGIIEKQIGKNFPQEIKEHFIGREKEQIYNAFNEGNRQGFNDGKSWSENEKDISEYDDAKNYYNNTYENDDKFCICKNPTLGSSISKCGTCGEWFKAVH